MRCLVFICLLVAYQAHTSLQAPTRSPPQVEARGRPRSPLSSLIKRRPELHNSKAGKRFKLDFATHPDIVKLNDTSSKEYVEHAANLKSTLASEEGSVKLKFTKALERDMIDAGVEEKQQSLVKARLGHETKHRTDTEGVKNKKATHMEGFRSIREKYNAKRRLVAAERRNGQGEVDMSISEAMKSVGVTEDSTASDVEERSRELYPGNKRRGTARLATADSHLPRSAMRLLQGGASMTEKAELDERKQQSRRPVEAQSHSLKEKAAPRLKVRLKPLHAPHSFESSLSEEPWWDDLYR